MTTLTPPSRVARDERCRADARDDTAAPATDRSPAERRNNLLAAMRAARLAGACAVLAAAAPCAASARAFDGLTASVLVEPPAGRSEALAAGDLILLEEGQPRPVLSVAPLDGPWRVAVWFDLATSADLAPRNAALELAERARDLTALGPVEVVLADEDGPRAALPPTRDPLLLAETLSWIAVRETGADAQHRLREGFVRDLGENEIGGPPRGRPPPPLRVVEAVGEAAREAIGREAEQLAAGREMLLEWAVEAAGPEPRLLVFITSGFDEAPRDFYAATLSAAGLGDLAGALTSPLVRPPIEQLGGTLASYGWVVAVFVPATRSALLAPPAADEAAAEERVAEPPTAEDLEEDGTARVGGDLLDLFRQRRGGEKPERKLRDPLAPLAALVAATGGERITDARALPPLGERLARRVRVVYEAGPGARSGLAAVEARLAQGGERAGGPLLGGSRWAAAATPEVVAETRMGRLLAGDLDEGDLPLSAALGPGAGRFAEAEVLIRLAGDEARPGLARLRATVGVAWDTGPPSVVHRWLTGGQGAGADSGSAVYGVPVALPEGRGSRVGVIVEDLTTGRWGATLASLLPSGHASREAAADDLLLPAPRAIHLLAPGEALVVGRTAFETVIADARVARVEFRLDGEAAAERGTPPFSAVIDLGPLPRARRVEAIAFGPGGEEVGRDVLVVNEGVGAFRVRIVAPRPETLRQRPGPITGALDVEVDVRAPAGVKVGRVDFFWNTALVATRFAPPYRQRLVVPADSPQGFVRAVARLEDGTAREDVLFVNTPGSTERVEVNLVELYVVVSDADGRPVRGLGRETFRVEEAGEPQEIAAFSNAGDLPLSVGLAIDSSASMFVKLPRVQRAAGDFLSGSLGPRDRSFVVGFGGEPRLAQGPTAKLERLVEAVGRLRPDGRTAVWKGIVYSLVQLQGLPGRKALIVYTDGADEDPDFPYRTCLRFARRVGVPIYAILANDEIYRTGGKGLEVGAFLDRLERLLTAVGGRLYLARVSQDLGSIYQEIAAELRSQYLVAYYPRSAGGDTWREVRVKVAEPGLDARTISGYYR